MIDKNFLQTHSECVINNGLSPDYFYLTRGVRQGDHLSLYLFLSAVETLAIAVRENSNIKGITIEGKETKILQYADHTTAVLSDTNSAHAFFKLLDEFGNLSDLKINSSKTEGMWIGSLKNNEEKPFGIKWPCGAIKLKPSGSSFHMMTISYVQRTLMRDLTASKANQHLVF